MVITHLKSPHHHQLHSLTRSVPVLEHRRRTPPPEPTVRVPPLPPKQKVVVVMGATGTGKSRLAVDLALHFNGEVVNSDKMQMHEGLDICTNKVTAEECKGVPHHLLSIAGPDADYSAYDFHLEASRTANMIACNGRLPIVAGGSNSYLEELVDGGSHRAFRKGFECCFLWVDVRLPVLHSFVSQRVDRMVERGLVEEVADMFNPNVDYKRGIRRAIGLPEMDRYLRSEGSLSGRQRSRLLRDAINEIKANTCSLASRQLTKIQRLRVLPGWNIHRIDATEIFQEKGKAFDTAAWYRLVEAPSIGIVREFLQKGSDVVHDDDEKHIDHKIRKRLPVMPVGGGGRIRCKEALTGTVLVPVGATV